MKKDENFDNRTSSVYTFILLEKKIFIFDKGNRAKHVYGSEHMFINHRNAIDVIEVS